MQLCKLLCLLVWAAAVDLWLPILRYHTSVHVSVCVCVCVNSYVGKPIGTRAVPQLPTGVAKPLTQIESGKTEHHPPFELHDHACPSRYNDVEYWPWKSAHTILVFFNFILGFLNFWVYPQQTNSNATAYIPELCIQLMPKTFSPRCGESLSSSSG